MLKTLTTLAAFALLASPVLADPSQPPSRAVGYGDLDLGSPQGQAKLASRIRGAVTAVCGAPNPLELREVSNVRKCRRTASDNGRSDAAVAIAHFRTQATDRLAARR